MKRKAFGVLVTLILIANVGMASNTNEEDDKITICHVPPGNPENAHAITVDKNAWENGDSTHNSHVLDFVIDSNNPCPPVTQIPEFPAIALPVAAIIGLLYLFQRGKGKE